MSDSHRDDGKRAQWRDAWNRVIVGHDTFAGRPFDLVLLILILLAFSPFCWRACCGFVKATVPLSGLRSGASLHFLRSNTLAGSFRRIASNATPEASSASSTRCHPVYLRRFCSERRTPSPSSDRYACSASS